MRVMHVIKQNAHTIVDWEQFKQEGFDDLEIEG
jgi:hypothetical protein